MCVCLYIRRLEARGRRGRLEGVSWKGGGERTGERKETEERDGKAKGKRRGNERIEMKP